jgi:hypothetical protein
VRDASELENVSPQICLWRTYAPSAKAELFSTALSTPAGVILVDPVPLAPEGLSDLAKLGGVSGIVVTSTNHIRNAVEFSDRFDAPLFAHQESFPRGKPGRFKQIKNGDRIFDALDVIAIDGAAAGEIAVYSPMKGGTMVVGDALIHFEPYGFTFLPSKYCIDVGEMKRSLRKLLAYKFDRILLAHGLPIVSRATDRLRNLLNSEKGAA